MPRTSKSFPSPLSKDLNASRRSEPRLNQELPQEVFDHLHARREAGHPYKYTTKDVRAILRYVNDKPEPARPSFFTKADEEQLNRTRRSARQYGERTATEREQQQLADRIRRDERKPPLIDRIERPRLVERISAGTNAAPAAPSPIIDFENKSTDRIIAIFIPKIRATLRRLAIVVKLERFELLPNDIRLPVRNFVDALDRFYNVIAAYHTITNRAEWQALNYGLIEIGKISFKNLSQRHDEIALQVSRVVRGGYFEILVGKNNPLVPLGL